LSTGAKTLSSALIRRFPALADVPRVGLIKAPTPVAPLASISPSLWIKRDDLSADPLGGNKVRALEYLLASVKAGDRVVTVGSAGSTHALAVAVYGRQLGARVRVGRWRQTMNPTAGLVAERVAATAERAPTFRSPAEAYVWAWLERLRGAPAHWIAAGGSTPLGVLGHVNAGLELIEQIDAGQMPSPRYVAVPLGTGGTAAGLALAFAIARREIVVVGVRVVPRIVGRRARVMRLAHVTARLIEERTGERLPRVGDDALRVVHEAYGGSYGMETGESRAAAMRLDDASGVQLDASYSAKGFQVALDLAEDAPTLFWLTFDPRTLPAP
jgi:D-cysteine desulfhydrase